MTFTPRATAGVRPPTDLSIGAQSQFQWLCSQVLIGSTKHLKNPLGQCLFSLCRSSPPCCLVLAQVGAYQRQSNSVMWPNHLDTHLACSSEDSYEYSGYCQGPVRGRKKEMRMADYRGCVSRKGEKVKQRERQKGTSALVRR